jgi:hybrid cluster-associated redox disulfide protein
MHQTITADHIVSEVLATWPKIVPLFIERRLFCVGCSMARFETLADVSKIYRLDLDQFLEDLNRQANNK